MGYLNEIISRDENIGRKGIWRKHLFMCQFMQNLEGIDLGLVEVDSLGIIIRKELL